MGSYEEHSTVVPETPNETQPDSTSGFNSNTLLSNLYSASEKQEESLVGDLKNLTLEENGYADYNNNNNNNNRNENLEVDWQSEDNSQYPLRPHAEDCSFYLKSGHCKFGYYCKFNHPVRRAFQGKVNHQGLTVEQKRLIECKYYRGTGGCMYGNSCRYRHSNEDYALTPLEVNSLAMPVQGINEKMETDGFSEQTEQIECKYYLSPGGCKYGKACRYRHSKEKSRYLEKSEVLPLELNFLGLPIRRLEKECPYYMRTGSCAYGSSCRYNHPDPTAAEESSAYGSDPSGFRDHSPGNYNGSSLSLNKMSNEHLTYLNHNSPFANGMHANSEWSGHQETTTNPYLAPLIDKEIKTADISKLHQEQIQVDEFPERPGEPECPHFMKTGFCKFKSACKFHHPEARLPKPILSNAGLPLRPDRRICWNYEKSGICKYGISCYFHHPQNLVS